MSQRRSRAVLLGIVAIFAAPLLLSVVLVASGYRPGADSNVGTLLAEPLDFRAVAATRADGSAVAWNPPEGLWHAIVPLPAGDCGPPCVRMVDSMQRVWLGLGRKNTRVRMLFAGTPDPATAEALARFPQAAVVALGDHPLPAPPPPLARLADGSEALAPLPVHLVDPNGWYVMRYEPGTDPRGLRKDLRRLVR